MMNTRNLIFKLAESENLGNHSKLTNTEVTNESTEPEVANEEATNEEATNEDATNEDAGYYVCPACGARFRLDDAEESAEEDEDEDDEDVDEAKIRVRGGKVQKLTKKPKKGYKVTKGQYVKMSQKEIKARTKSAKKMRRFSQTGTAKRKRAKSMKVRRRLVSSAQLESSLNNELMVDTVNAAISEAYKTLAETYAVPTVESIDASTYSDGNLTMEAVVSYDDDGDNANVTFTVEGFDGNGEFTMTDSEGIFGESADLTIGLSLEEGVVEPTSLDYEMNLGESVISGGVVLD